RTARTVARISPGPRTARTELVPRPRRRAGARDGARSREQAGCPRRGPAPAAPAGGPAPALRRPLRPGPAPPHPAPRGRSEGLARGRVARRTPAEPAHALSDRGALRPVLSARYSVTAHPPPPAPDPPMISVLALTLALMPPAAAGHHDQAMDHYQAGRHAEAL